MTVTTSHLQRDTLAVLRWADEHAIGLRDFAARPASLEKVFQRIADSDTGKDAA